MEKLTPEQLEEEASRMTPDSFFTTGETYSQCAKALESHSEIAGYRDSVISFLYHHAIESYLKAFLRFHGVSPSVMRNLGHKILKVYQKAQEHGLVVSTHDEGILKLVEATDVPIRDRYIAGGADRKNSSAVAFTAGEISLIGPAPRIADLSRS